MKLSAYLSSSRHGIFYFRWSLPRLEGQSRKTLRLSLRTRCPDRAGDLARYLASCGRLIKGNSKLAQLKQDQMRGMVRDFFQASLTRYLVRLDGAGISQNALEEMRHELELHEDFLGFNTSHPQYLPVEKFRRVVGLSEETWTDNEFVLVNEMRKARRDVLQSVLHAHKDRQQYFGPKPCQSLENLSQVNHGHLGDALSDFMAEHSPQWSGTMVQKMQAYLAILLEYFGTNKNLSEITRQDASELKKTLLALPASRKTKPQTKDLTLMEAVAVPDLKKIGVKTVNSHIDAFRRFFEWAERNGYAPNKLFDRMKVANARNAETKRMPFSKEQARKIFDELTNEQSVLVRQEHHKWGALISLFTGARLGEISQIEVRDIQNENGIWLLDINDIGPQKRLKSNAAKRKVPLHTKLIELGFLDYVSKQKKDGRLFPKLSYNKQDGYGRNLGRWFNSSFLTKLEIKKPGVSFHCFRHTVITRLAQAGVEQPLIQEVVGHEREGVTQQVYMKEGYTLTQKRDAIERFQV